MYGLWGVNSDENIYLGVDINYYAYVTHQASWSPSYIFTISLDHVQSFFFFGELVTLVPHDPFDLEKSTRRSDLLFHRISKEEDLNKWC